jgi:2-hydroxychromene-2-carboxylate isomerase
MHIDYYASLNSPWTHLGAARIEALAARHGASLRIHPVDFGAIFPASGGLPLPKRAPQRQAYRLMELRRWRDFLGVPLTIEPKPFPSSEALSAPCFLALRETQGDAPAIRLAHRVLRAVWQDRGEPGDPAKAPSDAGIGKVSFDDDKLVENARALADAIQRAKPTGAKGTYVQKVSVSSTMGPGVRVDVGSLAAS